MFRRNSCHFFPCTLFAIIIVISAKPPPSSLPWGPYGSTKSVSKSMGPPPNGLDTITIPYGPKGPPFFPKFVDPKAMIATKTDYLNSLFGGVGPVNYPFAPPLLYASNIDDELSNDISNLENIASSDASAGKNVKRSMFEGIGGKFEPGASSLERFVPKFGSDFNVPFSVSSRRRRSILASKPSIPTSFEQLSPPYSGLSTITEESESDTSASTPNSAIPKQFLPGLFGPFGPFGIGPSSPVIDPNLYASKKTTFLNTLFSSLTTSTPETSTNVPVSKNTIISPGFWSPAETVTATATPKTTIVPPSFWAPSSIIPLPGEYTDKVTTFLNKLVESIKLNQMKATENETVTDDISNLPKSKFVRSLIGDSADKSKMTSSIDDLTTITAVKDAIVDSIIAELSSLKTDMISNFNELVLAEQSEIAKASAVSSKKTSKPFKSPFATLWGPPSPVDPALPYKQKMAILSKAFDMLTALQKNISTAVSEAIENHTAPVNPLPSSVSIPSDETEPKTYGDYMPVDSNFNSPFNISFWNTMKSKLAKFDAPTMDFATGKYTRALTEDAPITYTQADALKRNTDDYNLYEDDSYDNSRKNNFKRALKMSMHQGYQSMPPGTVETVQAGGGSIPGHEGGGIKLFGSQNAVKEEQGNKWAKQGEYFKNQYANHHHHHNHY